MYMDMITDMYTNMRANRFSDIGHAPLESSRRDGRKGTPERICTQARHAVGDADALDLGPDRHGLHVGEGLGIGTVFRARPRAPACVDRLALCVDMCVDMCTDIPQACCSIP